MVEWLQLPRRHYSNGTLDISQIAHSGNNAGSILPTHFKGKSNRWWIGLLVIRVPPSPELSKRLIYSKDGSAKAIQSEMVATHNRRTLQGEIGSRGKAHGFAPVIVDRGATTCKSRPLNGDS